MRRHPPYQQDDSSRRIGGSVGPSAYIFTNASPLPRQPRWRRWDMFWKRVISANSVFIVLLRYVIILFFFYNFMTAGHEITSIQMGVLYIVLYIIEKRGRI